MKFSSFTVRDWVYVALFGALWGALEMTLGAYLHVIFPSLANTFFTGLIMAGLGAMWPEPALRLASASSPRC